MIKVNDIITLPPYEGWADPVGIVRHIYKISGFVTARVHFFTRPNNDEWDVLPLVALKLHLPAGLDLE